MVRPGFPVPCREDVATPVAQQPVVVTRDARAERRDAEYRAHDSEHDAQDTELCLHDV